LFVSFLWWFFFVSLLMETGNYAISSGSLANAYGCLDRVFNSIQDRLGPMRSSTRRSAAGGLKDPSSVRKDSGHAAAS